MAVTIKDVAAAAGVSPSTVSRTCKDSPSISRETKERVRRIMAQLGYEPNFEAEPVEAFSKTIGIILPSSQRDVYENAFHLEIIRGIGQFCNQRRYVNTVITGQDDAEVLDAIQSMVANAQADGFILLYSKKDCPVAAYLRSEGLLHVIVGKAAQSANQTIYIDNDNALAGEEATDYLYEMGHRRIAYFGVSNAMLFSVERRRGYQMSLLKHGITPREEDCVEVNTLNDAYEEPLKALLTAPDHPTAMLVSDDILAVVLEQFCGKLGLRVPHHQPPADHRGREPLSAGHGGRQPDHQPHREPESAGNKDPCAAQAHPPGELLPAAGSLIKSMRPFPLFLREAERPHFVYFFRYSRGVMPKCALNARLK